MARYLNPINDVAFKRVFKHKEIMIGFLNNILRLKDGELIVDLTYIDKEEVPDIGQGRRSSFDMQVVDQANKKYIIEVQTRVRPGFLNRVQLYAAHSYSNQGKLGDKPEQLKGLMPLVVVVIVTENVFPDEVPCISYHDTRESQTKERYLFSLSYAFVELAKFNKKDEELASKEDYWLHYLSSSYQDKKPPETIKDKLVLKAYEEIERFNWTEEQYDAYFRAYLLIDAEKSGIEDSFTKGEAKGIAKGKAEGMAETKTKVACNLLAEGLDIKLVSKTTGLSEEEVKDLL